MKDIPIWGIMLASVYHAVAALALTVALLFMIDSIIRRRKSHAPASSFVGDYLHGWVDWARNLPRDSRVIFGRVESLPDQMHPYGEGYPLQVGIAHTAFAWGCMALYWSEQNVVWMTGLDLLHTSLPFIWCWFYGRGYLMHLRCVWMDYPHRWRLFLLGMLLYMPTSVLLRIWLY